MRTLTSFFLDVNSQREDSIDYPTYIAIEYAIQQSLIYVFFTFLYNKCVVKLITIL